MKGLFIPGITTEMFRNGCLESIEALMSEGKIFDIETDWAWIPVSEMLPEEETDVFICNANGDRAISRGSYSTEAKDDFIWYTSGWRFGKVVAWMPLPEPYRGDSDV